MMAVLTAKVWAADPNFHYAWADHAHFIRMYALIAQVIAIASYWGSSQLVAEGEGTIPRAFKVWFFHLLSFFVFGMVCAIVVTYLVPPLLLGVVLLLIVAVIAVPMWVYEMSFLRSLLFLLCFLFMLVVAGMGLGAVFATPLKRLALSVNEWRDLSQKTGRPPIALFQAKTAFIQALKPLEATAGNAALPRAERLRALNGIYQYLARYRATLIPADVAGIAEFELHKASYQIALTRLNSETASIEQTARR